ncbi:hypothetical protein DM01DRAFT_1405268 [Hesseltinella vesiculosa]|uniref:Uncharacterized protein n=1 Tax=Hesseltinella vesiculosa TaxID=101127 RepID=A0A1X2GRK5_9FUNG|nr:hypothetical protein DM01DRAFT_1405268 [Hesseltinella vesiculosa]
MSGSDGNDAFMAMLNNPVINPGGQPQPQAATMARSPNCCVQVNAASQTCQDKLMAASHGLWLTSETDMPWQAIQVAANALPEGLEDLEELGIWQSQDDDEDDDDRSVTTQSVASFFSHHSGHDGLAQVFEDLFDQAQVFLIGKRTIQVFVLGWLPKARAIVGLQSQLVYT